MTTSLSNVRLIQVETHKPKPDMLTDIINIEKVLIEMELQMSRRQQPFSEDEFALIERLDRILRRAKELYLQQNS